MGKRRILEEGASYTFRSYYEMSYETDEILAEFGYGLDRLRLNLPKSGRSLDRVSDLQARMEEMLGLVSLSSETARRETLVAPALFEVAHYCQCQVRIEYPLQVSAWLQGRLDYFLKRDSNLLVVEAKNADLSRGFTQLAVELIAISEVEDGEIFYGAVTTGDTWRFGRLDRTQRRISQDITLYRSPDDLENLLLILLGILETL
jgi:hypothetical protein